ncbi:hypothetical protein CERSUDRAFT_114144 [Gelatoporia subvermispora B]|uniref:Cytochrome P450 n=1 Tax=Ceriporiopsis subvermispora (strain B) TaxID=914234 RepID=M2QZB4_CERS8|nr:hypothetical protein CERSUDRAFT_114144 [Gelatoporia subvermispora B]
MSASMGIYLAAVSLCAVFSLLLRRFGTYKRQKSLPLPPGPKPWPLIGNVRDIPTIYPWKTYAEWGKQYGDIVHLRLFGQHMIVLNSWTDVSNLLEKRSANYSDRIHLEMLTLIGWDFSFGVMSYGPKWRKHRRAFHEHFNQTAVHAYRSQYLESRHKLLKLLHGKPEDSTRWIRHASGALIVSVVYGIELSDQDDEYVTLAEHAITGFANAANPGAFWVDFFPILKYVPPWVPGAGFQQKAAAWKRSTILMREIGWNNMVRDTPLPPVAALLAEKASRSEGDLRIEAEQTAMNVCGLAYAAGVDTVVSTLRTFVLAMAMYPTIQRKAQDELDSVIGCERLPDIQDQNALPYINAVLKESLRWQPVVPITQAHVTSAEDEYKGYRIPKGSVMLQNTWAILHDPVEYPDPEQFRPERFLKDGKLDPDRRDPAIVAFGSGRRICPGRHFSDLWLFISIASILHVFEICPTQDENGNPIELAPHMVPGFISHPAEFSCTIRPRSQAATALVLN